MESFSRHGKVGIAAMRAGMDRHTAGRYLRVGRLPSELRAPRGWRTREDPIWAEDWAEVVGRLRDAPELEAKTLFEELAGRHPERYQEGQLRTFQRKVRLWRAQEGPDKEVFFAQEHRPGEALQTDFTRGNELGVTIQGEPFEHLLCHAVLPYSNWGWVTVCKSESLAALRRGVQEAVFRLGMVPEYHQTDNSSSATHELATGKRGFNEEYQEVMAHLGMNPRTTKVGAKEQNGDVESLHRALKRRLKQHLLMRGSTDFESVAEYERFVQEVMEQANQLRRKRLGQELERMRPLQVRRLPEYREERVVVMWGSTIRVQFNIYSVPSRLIGEEVTVQVYDDRLEVHHVGRHQFTVERLHGRGGYRVDYRHVIASLMRKPGAFARYRYRDGMFPSVVFRKAYDRLAESLSGYAADTEYLRILHLAAKTREVDVEAALELLLEEKTLPRFERVEENVAPPKPEVPQMAALEVDLSSYDRLLALEVA